MIVFYLTTLLLAHLFYNIAYVSGGRTIKKELMLVFIGILVGLILGVDAFGLFIAADSLITISIRSDLIGPIHDSEKLVSADLIAYAIIGTNALLFN